MGEQVGSSIGNRIRELRTSKGWAFDHLARETGLSRGTLWEAEHKEGREPRNQTLLTIADALGVPVEYLRDGTMPSPSESLSDIPLELFAKANNVSDLRALRALHEQFAVYREFEALKSAHAENSEPERTLGSVSVEEFSRAHGLTDEKRIARVQEEFTTQLRLQTIDAVEANGATEQEL
jgi:transcriptional regulator with XRE-family HTH domain